MAQTMLNVFTGDYFSNITLTELVNQNYNYIPGLITNMNLAGEPTGIDTLDVAFDDISGGLRMIPTTPRGAPPSQHVLPKGRTRKLDAAHLAREIQVGADELLNKLQFHTRAPQTVQQKLMERVDGPLGVKAELAATFEHFWVGAVDGVVYDSDGSSILWDYFAWTGTSRPTAVNIQFTGDTADAQRVRTAAVALKRQTVAALNGLAIPANAQPTVLCGDNFYDALTSAPEIRSVIIAGATGNANAAQVLSRPYAYEAFEWAGIEWINYRQSTDGLIGIPTDEGRFFMRGIPGLFQMFFAPADTFDTVSDVGLPFYLLNNKERQTSKLLVFELQSNPLLACIRPNSLVRITKT